MIVKEELDLKIDQVKNLLRKNKYLEAKELCLNINSSSKENYETISLLAIIEFNLKNFETSLNYFEKAIKINDSDPKIYNNLGILYYKIGKIDNAIKYFNKAIEIDNTSINSYQNLAKINLSLNNYQKSKFNFEKVLEIDNKNLEALLSLSDILLLEKKYSEAKKILYKIIKLNSELFEVYNNLGHIHLELNEKEDALKNLNKSNEIKQNKAAYNNIGLIYKKKKKFDLSIFNFKQALNLDSDYLEALYNISIIYMEIGKFEKSIEYFKKILKIDPDYQRVLGKIFHCQNIICDWNNYFVNVEKIKEKILDNKNCITPWEILSIIDSEEIQLLGAQNWINKNFPKYDSLKNFNISKQNKKIKVGYFSPDFFKHAVSYQIAEMIELHDRSKFEIFAFSLIDKEDEMQTRLKKAFDNFINIENKSTDNIIKLCREINLDIAIDLSGFTLNNRFEIFERRCAPTQISFFGYSGTTGSKNMDYIIADKKIIPNESQKYFAEKIIYLPNSFMPNDSKTEISNLEFNKSKYKLPADSIILGCFNQHYKISPIIFDIWIKILIKNKSCFLLLAEGNNLSSKNLKKYAQKNGLDENRLIFTEKLERKDHLNRLKIVDIFIDTFPYCSHTTAYDALHVGKPLVSLEGKSFVSRISSSLLESFDLKELISNSFQDYENKINNLIKNKSHLKELNLKIIENRKKSFLFDTKNFTKNLEEAYIKVYENFINNK